MKLDKPIKLCRRGSCCPEISTTPAGNMRLTDDHNGMVILTPDEVDLLYVELTKLLAKTGDRE